MATYGIHPKFFMYAAILIVAIAVGMTIAMGQNAGVALAISELLTPSVAPQLAITVAHSRLLFLLALLFVPLFSIATFGPIRKWRDRELKDHPRSKTLGQLVFCLAIIVATTATFFFEEGRNCRICVQTSVYLNLVFRLVCWWLLSTCVNLAILNFRLLNKERYHERT